MDWKYVSRRFHENGFFIVENPCIKLFWGLLKISLKSSINLHCCETVLLAMKRGRRDKVQIQTVIYSWNLISPSLSFVLLCSQYSRFTHFCILVSLASFRLIDLLKIVSVAGVGHGVKQFETHLKLLTRLHYTIIITIINHYSFCWKGKRVRREFPLAALSVSDIQHYIRFYTQLTERVLRVQSKQMNKQINQPDPITILLHLASLTR